LDGLEVSPSLRSGVEIAGEACLDPAELGVACCMLFQGCVKRVMVSKGRWGAYRIRCGKQRILGEQRAQSAIAVLSALNSRCDLGRNIANFSRKRNYGDQLASYGSPEFATTRWIRCRLSGYSSALRCLSLVFSFAQENTLFCDECLERLRCPPLRNANQVENRISYAYF
jgi:hypothetical protein